MWDLRFLEEDCRTVVGRRFDVPSDQELFELAERGGASVAEIRQSIAMEQGLGLAEPDGRAVSTVARAGRQTAMKAQPGLTRFSCGVSPVASNCIW